MANFDSIDYGKLDSSVAQELNSYRAWNTFDVELNPIIKYDENGQKLGAKIKGKAVKSLFNNVNAVSASDKFVKTYNAPLLDSPKSRIEQKKQTACTIKDLVDASESGLMGRQIYNYSDFAYCKYLGKIPNNYLITLRRFANPCGDHIDEDLNNNTVLNAGTQNHNPDVGRLITWMGTPGNDLNQLLSYSYSMAWKQLEARLGEEQIAAPAGPLAKIFATADSSYGKLVQQGYSSTQDTTYNNISSKMTGGVFQQQASYDFRTLQLYDQNKVYGPLDVLTTTQIRDTGLKFDQRFNITFDYQMKSYDGINQRAAFLDLLSNILCVTYTTGQFWGGGYHFYGSHIHNVYTNLPIFDAANKGQLNTFAGVTNAVSASWQSVAGNEQKTNKQAFSDILKQIGSNLIGMLAGQMLNVLGRPQKMALNSLLSPAPTGCWHLTLGNPKAPIMEMGDLILKDAKIEHYGPLGLDDFPTGLKVTVQLEPSKPRDISKIEQMYMRGDSRIYIPVNDNVLDMYKNASSVSSKSSKSSKTGNNNNLYKSTISDSAGTDTVEVSSSTGINPVLMKYFGTTNETSIKVSAKEISYGSVSKQSDNQKINKYNRTKIN